MITFFQSKDLITEDSADWIFDVYLWAMENFDRKEFLNNTQLIQPTNEYFPGKVDNIHDMATSIFNHTARYCGVGHWPFKLIPPQEFTQCAIPNLHIENIRRSSTETLPSLDSAPTLSADTTEEINLNLLVSYNPQQTSRPGDLSANYAHMIAQHFVQQARLTPPGGMDLIIPATEVVAIFMGFGVLFSNSAYVFRGGCGSCFNPSANRRATLQEDEVIFALALFCKLKSIPRVQASRHLKSHLKGSLKRAEKQIEKNQDKLEILMSYSKKQ